MYIVTLKETEEIVGIGNSLEYLDNGYPVLTEENVCFPADAVKVFDAEDVPDQICKGKHCYNEDRGVYENPGWREPDRDNIFGVPDDVYQNIKDQAMIEIQQEVKKSAD
ncbi:MAG: hypothetical protein MR562_01360 [Clostridiaceae bacterium]|nr:hypothetical protein [Clostridiaceae bacterium]